MKCIIIVDWSESSKNLYEYNCGNNSRRNFHKVMGKMGASQLTV